MKRDITILCRVVDNYGDIGFAYRLSRRLRALRPELCVRMVVSDLKVFAVLAPGVRAESPRQSYQGLELYDWHAAEECTQAFLERPPCFIVECLECGRPEWLEALLFGPQEQDSTVREVHVINVEYLTAEAWADDFHLLTGATRSARVKKLHFMPGFSSRTGGMLLDEPFLSYIDNTERAHAALENVLSASAWGALRQKNCCSVLIFSYARDFMPLVCALARHQQEVQKKITDFRVVAFVAAGQSHEPFCTAWRQAGMPFAVVELPYLAQTHWDALMAAMDVLVIRGEDSFSRACLCGVPFLWHAYPQDEEFQLVKVDAFLQRLRSCLEPAHYERVRLLMLLYNRRFLIELGAEAATVLAPLKEFPSESDADACLEHAMTAFLRCADDMRPAFVRFARHLRQNGDLGQHLLHCMESIDEKVRNQYRQKCGTSIDKSAELVSTKVRNRYRQKCGIGIDKSAESVSTKIRNQ